MDVKRIITLRYIVTSTQNEVLSPDVHSPTTFRKLTVDQLCSRFCDLTRVSPVDVAVLHLELTDESGCITRTYILASMETLKVRPFRDLDMLHTKWECVVYIVLRLGEDITPTNNVAFWQQERGFRDSMREEHRLFYWHWTYGLVAFFFFAETMAALLLLQMSVGIVFLWSILATVLGFGPFATMILVGGFTGSCGSSMVDHIQWCVELGVGGALLIFCAMHRSNVLTFGLFGLLVLAHHVWRILRHHAYSEWQARTWKTLSPVRATILRLRYKLYYPPHIRLCQINWLQAYRRIHYNRADIAVDPVVQVDDVELDDNDP